MLEQDNLVLSEIEVPTSDIQRARYDVDNIPIVATVKITEDMVGRLDTYILRQYFTLVPLPIVLDFNGYSDISEVKAGAVLSLPHLSYFNREIKIIQDINDGDYEVPGINKHDYDNLSKEEHAATVQTQQSKTATSTKTTANPKLKVTVNKVHADLSKGTITF